MSLSNFTQANSGFNFGFAVTTYIYIYTLQFIRFMALDSRSCDNHAIWSSLGRISNLSNTTWAIFRSYKRVVEDFTASDIQEADEYFSICWDCK